MERSLASRHCDSDTVVFDVGGRLFTVLREPTLSLHPGSVLKQMADDHTGSDAIYVEANPDLFEYIVEYHRNRKVYLPLTVAKNSLIMQAEKLGITIDPADVCQERPLATLTKATLGAIVDMSEKVAANVQRDKLRLFADLILKGFIAKMQQEPLRTWVCVTYNDLASSSGKGVIDFLMEDKLTVKELCSIIEPQGQEMGYNFKVRGNYGPLGQCHASFLDCEPEEELRPSRMHQFAFQIVT